MRAALLPRILQGTHLNVSEQVFTSFCLTISNVLSEGFERTLKDVNLYIPLARADAPELLLRIPKTVLSKMKLVFSFHDYTQLSSTETITRVR
jgi:hypothetical protein